MVLMHRAKDAELRRKPLITSSLSAHRLCNDGLYLQFHRLRGYSRVLRYTPISTFSINRIQRKTLNLIGSRCSHGYSGIFGNLETINALMQKTLALKKLCN